MASPDLPTPLSVVETLKDVFDWFISQLGSFWSWVIGIIGGVVILSLFLRLFRHK